MVIKDLALKNKGPSFKDKDLRLENKDKYNYLGRMKTKS